MRKRPPFKLPVLVAAAVIAGVTGAVVITRLRDQILPARFSYDSVRIQLIALGRVDSYGDQSYGSVGSIYAALGLANDAALAALCGTLLVIVTNLIAIRISASETLPRPAVSIVIFLSIIFGGVFLGAYSKDVFVLLIVAIALLAPARWYGEVALLAAIFVYADNFRAYWAMVAIGYVAFRILRIYRRSLSALVFGMIGMVIASGVIFIVGFGHSADFYRIQSNRTRTASEDAQSMIEPFLSLPEPLGGVVNSIITLPALLFPLPLALKGGGYYIFLSLTISTIWFIFFGAVKQIGAHTLEIGSRSRALTDRAISLTAAFLGTQAMFEPDYGSALRHVTPLLPLMVVVVWTGSTSSRTRTMSIRRSAMLPHSVDT